MLRRSSLIAIVALMCSFGASAFAATAPSQAPLLTSSPFASPVTIHWTPAADAEDTDDDDDGPGRGAGQGNGRGHEDDDEDDDSASFQSVLRALGPCTVPAAGGREVARFPDATTSVFSDPVPDGTYCYSIEVTDDSGAADSPGLTVVVDARARAAAGTEPLATASSIPVTAPAPVGAADTLAPTAPTGLTVSLGRAKHRDVHIPVTVRWANPAAADLARVELVINRGHPPRNLADGQVVYRGLGRSFVLTLRAGQSGHLALFAVDHSGNVSSAARRRVSLVALVPLRPLSGSSIRTAPLLRWERKQGAAYYNLQVFRNGKRVLVAWPSRASYRFPAAKLHEGTYVWFVWPALKAASASPRYADLIGRATFVYTP